MPLPQGAGRGMALAQQRCWPLTICWVLSTRAFVKSAPSMFASLKSLLHAVSDSSARQQEDDTGQGMPYRGAVADRQAYSAQTCGSPPGEDCPCEVGILQVGPHNDSPVHQAVAQVGTLQCKVGDRWAATYSTGVGGAPGRRACQVTVV